MIDIQRLLEEEESSSKEAGWKSVSKSDLVETWSKSEENQSVHLVKVCEISLRCHLCTL